MNVYRIMEYKTAISNKKQCIVNEAREGERKNAHIKYNWSTNDVMHISSLRWENKSEGVFKISSKIESVKQFRNL